MLLNNLFVRKFCWIFNSIVFRPSGQPKADLFCATHTHRGKVYYFHHLNIKQSVDMTPPLIAALLIRVCLQKSKISTKQKCIIAVTNWDSTKKRLFTLLTDDTMRNSPFHSKSEIKGRKYILQCWLADIACFQAWLW